MSGTRKTVKPRFWLFIMGIFAIALLWSYLSQVGFIAQQVSAISDLEEQKLTLTEQNAGLKRQIDFTYTDEFIIREARDKLGLLGEDEILFESND